MPEPDIAALLERAAVMSNDHAMWATNPDGVKSYIEGAAVLRDLARRWLVYKAAVALADAVDALCKGTKDSLREELAAYRAAKAAADAIPSGGE